MIYDEYVLKNEKRNDYKFTSGAFDTCKLRSIVKEDLLIWIIIDCTDEFWI